MAKKKNKQKRKEETKTKFSKILTPEQKAKFKEFGEPDLSQNWLELFTGTVLEDLSTIMTSCSDNQKKAEYVSQELSAYGFYDVGLGTNILTMANPAYPGVVFKFALDDFGIADNFNDVELSKYVPRYNRVFARDPSAMISVQERLVLPTRYQMEMFEPNILAVLKDLSKYFLVADLSPENFLNYGVTRDGQYRFIDGSDLYPLSQLPKEPRCTRITGEHKHTGKFKYCEGKLKYTEDYSRMICQSCGKEYIPLEFRPRKDVNRMYHAISDGLTADERRELERAELGSAVANKEEDDNDKPAYLGNDELDELVAGMRNRSRNIFASPGEMTGDPDDGDESDEADEVPVIRPKSRWDEDRSGEPEVANDRTDGRFGDVKSGDESNEQEDEFDNPTFVVSDDEDESEQSVEEQENEESKDPDRDEEGFFVLRPRQAPLPVLTEDTSSEERTYDPEDESQGEEDPSQDEDADDPENVEAAEESEPADIRTSDEYQALKEKILHSQENEVSDEKDGDESDTAEEISGEDSPTMDPMTDGHSHDSDEVKYVSTLVNEASASVQEDAGQDDPDIAQFQRLVAILKERQEISSGDKAVYRGLLKTVRGVKVRAIKEFASNAEAYFDPSRPTTSSRLEQEQFDQVREAVIASLKSDVSRSITPDEVSALHGIIERQGHINDSLLRELNERGNRVVKLEHQITELQSKEVDVNDHTSLINEKDAQIEELQKKLSELTAELQSAKDSADTYIGELKTLTKDHEAELGSVRADAEARLASLQEENTKLRAEIEQSSLNSKAVNDVLSANAGFELKIQQQNKEIETLKTKIAQQTKLLAENAQSAGDDDYDQLLQEKKALEAEVEELRAQVADTEAVDTMARELEELRVKIDAANKVISGMTEEDTRPDRVHYHVINEKGIDVPSGSPHIPGIYLDIIGDFQKAFDETGLSIFVGLNNTTYYKSIDYKSMLGDIKESYDELVEDSAPKAEITDVEEQ